MLYMYGLYVLQQGQSYKLYTPQGEPIGLLFMGYDGQYMKDMIAIKRIAQDMGERWGTYQPRQSNPKQGRGRTGQM